MHTPKLCNSNRRRRGNNRSRSKPDSSAIPFRGLTGTGLSLPGMSKNIPETRHSIGVLRTPWMLGFISALDQIKTVSGNDPMLAIQEALTKWTESQASNFCDGIDVEFFLRLTCGAALKEYDSMDDYYNMSDDDAIIAIGLHTPAFCFVGPVLTELENNFSGLGRRILSALNGCPLEIFTPSYVEETMECRWDEWDDIDEEDSFFGNLTRKAFESVIPEWARCYSKEKMYKGDLPKSIGDQLIKLEALSEEYWSEYRNSKVANCQPMGGVTGVCLMWTNDDDDIIKRVWDGEVEYAQQTGTELFISTFFNVDFKTEKDPASIFSIAGKFLHACDAAFRLLSTLTEEKNKIRIMN